MVTSRSKQVRYERNVIAQRQPERRHDALSVVVSKLSARPVDTGREGATHLSPSTAFSQTHRSSEHETPDVGFVG